MNDFTSLRTLLGKGFATLLALLFLVPSLRAQGDASLEGAPYSLEQCIQYALRNHKNIKNARFDTYIAEARVRELRAVGLPQVSLNASYTNYLELPVSVIDIRNFNLDPSQPTIPEGLPDSVYFQVANFGLAHNAQVTGQVTQLLFDGSFFVGLKAAKEFVNLNEIRVTQTEEQTAVNVAKAYYGALVNEERARLLNANLNRLSEFLETTRVLYQQGFSEKVDVDRLTIQLNNLRVEKQKVDQMVTLGYDLLKFQMGMPIDANIYLTDRIESGEQVQLSEPEAMSGDMAQNRIEMKLLEQQVSLQELNIKRYRSGALGSLAAFGTAQYLTARPRFFSLETDPNWFRTSFFGLQYSVTLFDGLQKRSLIQQSELTIDQARNNMDMFRESVKLETRNALTSVDNAYMDVQNAQRNVELSEEVYRISTTKYKEGLGSNLEIIDAESTLMESQINYLAALYDYTLARVELRRLMGEFNPDQNPELRNQQ